MIKMNLRQLRKSGQDRGGEPHRNRQEFFIAKDKVNRSALQFNSFVSIVNFYLFSLFLLASLLKFYFHFQWNQLFTEVTPLKLCFSFWLPNDIRIKESSTVPAHCPLPSLSALMYWHNLRSDSLLPDLPVSQRAQIAIII